MIVLPPDAKSLVTVVNFTVTHAGLEGQLLSVTLQHEKPELELKKSDLLRQEEDLKLQLSTLEKQLLQQLASSEGNILENKALLASLTDTKTKSLTINQSLTQSQELQGKLDQEREVFRPFAVAGSTVYFMTLDLRIVNHMYQFSLPIFLHLFGKTLDAAGARSSLAVLG